jgi:hypothetical protein
MRVTDGNDQLQCRLESTEDAACGVRHILDLGETVPILLRREKAGIETSASVAARRRAPHRVASRQDRQGLLQRLRIELDAGERGSSRCEQHAQRLDVLGCVDPSIDGSVRPHLPVLFSTSPDAQSKHEPPLGQMVDGGDRHRIPETHDQNTGRRSDTRRPRRDQSEIRQRTEELGGGRRTRLSRTARWRRDRCPTSHRVPASLLHGRDERPRPHSRSEPCTSFLPSPRVRRFRRLERHPKLPCIAPVTVPNESGRRFRRAVQRRLLGCDRIST